MNSAITRKSQQELEDKWFRQLNRVNSALNQAENVREYLAVLNNQAAWNSLSFCLRRYLYERETGRDREEPSIPYTVTLGQHTYSFSPVVPDRTPDEEELERYADLFYRMTVENGCLAVDKKGNIKPKLGAITKKTYVNYLHNKGISRRLLFVLSMALGFDTAAMDDLMNALGESPVYNFRDVDECIYYFCHNTPACQSMAAFRQLRKMYDEKVSSDIGGQKAGQSNTRLIRRGIDRISYGEYPDDDAMKAAFVDHLVTNSGEFVGYSKTARELFRRELDSDRVMGFDYSLVEARNVCEVNLWRDTAPTEDAKNRVIGATQMSTDAVGNELFAVLVEGSDLVEGEEDGEKLRIDDLDMDSRLTRNLLNGPRLRALLSEHAAGENLTKKDFLTLRFYKLALSLDFSALSEPEHFEVLCEFHDSTDRILLQAGLPEIYMANPFEHLIFAALCSKSPLDFLPKVFRAARTAPPEGDME